MENQELEKLKEQFRLAYTILQRITIIFFTLVSLLGFWKLNTWLMIETGRSLIEFLVIERHNYFYMGIYLITGTVFLIILRGIEVRNWGFRQVLHRISLITVLITVGVLLSIGFLCSLELTEGIIRETVPIVTAALTIMTIFVRVYPSLLENKDLILKCIEKLRGSLAFSRNR